MQHSKTKLGLKLFDQAFGGIYFNRPTIIRGPKKVGKFILATHFIGKTIQSGERIILFTDKRPDDVLLDAKSLDFDFAPAIASGQLMLISYRTISNTENGFDPFRPLPFEEAFKDLKTTVNENGVHFAVFDTAVPWLAKEPFEEMETHVETFVSLINQLELTTLLLMPKAVSPEAKALSEKLNELCPIIIEMVLRRENEHFVNVVKYQGNTQTRTPMEFLIDILPGRGITNASENKEENHGSFENVQRRTFKPLVNSSFSGQQKKNGSFSSNQRPTDRPKNGKKKGMTPLVANSTFGAKNRPQTYSAPSSPRLSPNSNAMRPISSGSHGKDTARYENDNKLRFSSVVKTRSSEATPKDSGNSKPSFSKALQTMNDDTSRTKSNIGTPPANDSEQKPHGSKKGIKFSNVIQ